MRPRHMHADVVRLQVGLLLWMLMYTFEGSYVHEEGCMTLFASPRDVVGLATVRGTGPKHFKTRRA